MRNLLALVCAIVLGLTGLAKADNVALVIGNGGYAHAPAAETAVRDSKAVAEALENAGWTVFHGTDLDRAGMRRTLAEFSTAQADADATVIFYSGHALRTGEQTFMVPTGFNEVEIPFVMLDSVPFDLVLTLAARTPGKSVVFVDGAQLRGFSPTQEIEPGISDLSAPEGVLIVSAAPPRQAVRRSKWRDSRFARIIIDQFLSPGASAMEQATRAEQPIWHTGSTHADFALVAAPDTTTGGGIEHEIELAYWRTAERTGNPEDYREYLDRYPNGIFADFARERLGLRAGQPVPQEPQVDPVVKAEQDLGLSRRDRREVQTWLSVLGHNPRGIDGLFGKGSRNAIRAWQRTQGFDATGFLNQTQYARLQRQGQARQAELRRQEEQKRRVAAAQDNAYWQATGANGKPDALRAYLKRYPEGLHAVEARAALAAIAEAQADQQARRERRAFRRAQDKDTAAAYREYLARFPEGIYRDQALARLDQIEGAERESAQLEAYQRTEAALRLSQSDRQSVEARLRALGFPTGNPDGKFTRRTRKAIKGYQASRDLRETGYLNQRTVIMLVRETSQVPQGQVQLDGAQVIRGLIEALGKR